MPAAYPQRTKHTKETYTKGRSLNSETYTKGRSIKIDAYLKPRLLQSLGFSPMWVSKAY